MSLAITSIRLDTRLADEAVRILRVKSRTEAVHVALREIVALRRFKDLMKKMRADFHSPLTMIRPLISREQSHYL